MENPHTTAERLAIEIAKSLGLNLDSIDIITRIVAPHLLSSDGMDVQAFAGMVGVDPETIRRMINNDVIPQSAYLVIGSKKRKEYRIDPVAAIAAMRRKPAVPMPSAPRRARRAGLPQIALRIGEHPPADSNN